MSRRIISLFALGAVLVPCLSTSDTAAAERRAYVAFFRVQAGGVASIVATERGRATVEIGVCDPSDGCDATEAWSVAGIYSELAAAGALETHVLTTCDDASRWLTGCTDEALAIAQARLAARVVDLGDEPLVTAEISYGCIIDGPYDECHALPATVIAWASVSSPSPIREQAAAAAEAAFAVLRDSLGFSHASSGARQLLGEGAYGISLGVDVADAFGVVRRRSGARTFTASGTTDMVSSLLGPAQGIQPAPDNCERHGE